MYNPLSLSSLGLSSTCTPDAARPFVTSHFLHPYALASLRAVISVYCFTTIIFGYAWLGDHNETQTLKDIHIPTYHIIQDEGFITKSFSFFTFLTFWSLAFYFAISAFHTFDYARSLSRNGVPAKLYLQRSFACHWSFRLAYHVWHTTITTYPFLVSIVFWATMNGGPWPMSRFQQWINISVHGLNSLFAIIEIACSATGPAPFFSHLLMVFGFLSMYLGLAYLSKATADFYPYAWMDPRFGWQNIVGHVAGYAGGIAAIYSIVWAVSWSKQRIVGGCPSGRGVVVEEDETKIWSETSSSYSKSSLGAKTPVVVEVHAV